MKPITIGLTGGIGSGKSTAAKILAELGAPAIDADRVGHEIYQPGAPAYRELVDAFGEGILAPDHAIDRRKLGPIVFADPAALKLLNAIVHPKMFARMGEMVAAMRRGGETRPIVIEAAILIEANWQPLFDEIWLVTASREQVVARVERDRGLRPEQTDARIRAQLSDDERRKYATTVIRNDGTLEELRAAVTLLWQEAVARAA
ncbi:MAG TPA: dephospho-CoA kinase [Candidatus Binataceae bacterium]